MSLWKIDLVKLVDFFDEITSLVDKCSNVYVIAIVVRNQNNNQYGILWISLLAKNGLLGKLGISKQCKVIQEQRFKAVFIGGGFSILESNYSEKDLGAHG